MRIIAKIVLMILATPFYIMCVGGWLLMLIALLGLYDPDLHKYTEAVPMNLAITVVGHVGIALTNALRALIEKKLPKTQI
jgi:hypothetical protein